MIPDEQPTAEQLAVVQQQLREKDLSYLRMQQKAYAEEVARFERKRDLVLRAIERLEREIDAARRDLPT